MARAAIYARYSSEMQNARSIEDQVALCRNFAAREGLTIVETYEDRALSGTTLVGRNGLLALMRDAEAGKFDAVIVEDLNRLGRDTPDLIGIHRQLSFMGVEALQVFGGAADETDVLVNGFVSHFWLKDLKNKVRRGQAGRVRAGKVTAGLAYGYDCVPGQPGERVIVEHQAEIIRRIFREAAEGKPVRQIAKSLNAEGIAPPYGKAWCYTTLYGGPKRGGGMLRNKMYIGQLEWNRVPELRDPRTGKRTTRPSRPEDRVTADAPGLRIVDQAVWDAVSARFEREQRPDAPVNRRRMSLLSGLLRCAACGAGMSSRGKCPDGRRRVGCSRHRESGDCPRPQTLYLDTIEGAVLAGLKRELLHPCAIEVFVSCYREERERLAAGAGDRGRRIETRLGNIATELDRITDFLIRGVGDEARLDARARELAAEEKQLRAELAAVPRMPKMIAPDAELIARYRDEIERLETGLADRMAASPQSAGAQLREMITSVTASRDARSNQIIIEVEGTLPLASEHPANALGVSLVGPEGREQRPQYQGGGIPFKFRACA